MIKQRIMAMLLAVSMITTTLVSPVVEAQAADVPQIEINEEVSAAKEETNEEVPAAEKEIQVVSDATSGDAGSVEKEVKTTLEDESVDENAIFDSGTVDGITWSLTEGGHLTINGTGDVYSTPWKRYKEYTYSAEVSITGATDFSRLFYNYESLGSVVFSGTDTSNVTDMSYMFSGCDSLRELDLNGLDTSNVTDMSYMFSGCVNLRELNLNGLDTSNATNMSHMFNECNYLEKLNLSGLDTSNVTNMSHLFYRCQMLSTLDLSSFDTSKVTNMDVMFYDCRSLEKLDLNNFNTSNVTDMSELFFYCEKLQEVKVSGFDTSNVKDMSYMFFNCWNLKKLDLSNFDTSNVTDMQLMFNRCSKLSEIDISSFDTSNVRNMTNMFDGCKNLEKLDVSSFDTSNVRDYQRMFADCTKLILLDLSNFDMSGISYSIDVSNMFSGSGIVELYTPFKTDNITANLPYKEETDDLETTTVTYTPWVDGNGTMHKSIPENLKKSIHLKKIKSDVDVKIKYSGVSNDLSWSINEDNHLVLNGTGDYDKNGLGIKYAKNVKSAKINVKNISSLKGMFYGFLNIESVDLSNLDTSNVKNMSNMFDECSNLKELDLSNFDTSNVTNMSNMFDGCKSLQDLDISSFDTSKVTNISNMFNTCKSLQKLDLSMFNMQQVSKASNALKDSGILELHTPYNVNTTIELPTAKSGERYMIWYDDNGNNYSNVPKNLEESIFLSAVYTDATSPDATSPDATSPDATSPNATSPDASRSILKEGKNEVSVSPYRTYKFEFTPNKTGCYDIYTSNAKFIGKIFGGNYTQKIHGYATRTGMLKEGETYTLDVYVYCNDNEMPRNIGMTIDILYNSLADTADSNLEPELFEEGNNQTGLWANYDYKFSFTPKESGIYNIVTTNGMFVGELSGSDYSQQINSCSIRTGLLKAGETYTFSGVCIGVDEYEGSSDKIFINVNISFNENHAHLYLDTDWTTEKAATCTEEGLEVCVCSVEGCNEQTTRVIPVTEHTKAVDKAVAATCEGTGLTEGSHCSVCKKVLVAQEVVPALGHTKVVDKAVAATCEGTGLTEGSHCSVCKKVLVAQKVVPALGHTKVVDKAVAATCEGTGLTEGSHCSVCKKVLVAQKVVPALGHTKVVDKAVAATCEGTGLTEGSHCSVCKKVLVAQKVVPALGHTVVTDKAVKATFEAAGLTKGSHCSTCNKVFVEQKVIPQIGSVKLSYTKVTYNGSVKKPAIIVKDSEGNLLEKGTDMDYDVTYASGRKAVGRYKVTVTFKGNYSGTTNLYFTIVPKAPASVIANLYGYDDVKVSWKKVTGASGYTVYYKKASASSYKSYKRTTGTSIKISGLSDGVKYSFKVVPYYKSGTTRYASLTSKVASVYTLKKLSTPIVSTSGTSVRVKWNNISGETGYQISRSTSKTGTNIVSTYKTTSGTYKKVSATKGKKYYYKVRAYKVVDGKKIYAPWSAVKVYKR